MNRHLIVDQEYRAGYPFGGGLTKSISTFIIDSIVYFVHLDIYILSYAFFQHY